MNKKKVLLLMGMCGILLVGCGNNAQVIEQKDELENSSSQENEKKDNKFIGIWTTRNYGQYWGCCVSSSGKAYIAQLEDGDMRVEEKQIFDYEIKENMIYLKNDQLNYSFELQEDKLVGNEKTYSRADLERINIYEDEKGDDDTLIEVVEFDKE